ncbi:MAG: 50S ribosomal protein L7/L12, partial [Marinobacter salsuginis]
MALSNEDILNAIAEMSVMDVVALVEAMEEKFGVSAAAAVAAAPAAAGAPDPQGHQVGGGRARVTDSSGEN